MLFELKVIDLRHEMKTRQGKKKVKESVKKKAIELNYKHNSDLQSPILNSVFICTVKILKQKNPDFRSGFLLVLKLISRVILSRFIPEHTLCYFISAHARSSCIIVFCV